MSSVLGTTFGGAVYISNEDDYVNPSQACVNPIFNGKQNESQQQEQGKEGGVVLRKRGEKRTNEIVTATIADCLACSGCVTTAETVLIEERHNLEKLLSARQPLVFTVSPAAMADWRRQFGHSGEVWAAVWKQYLNVWAVVDGNLPLQWSRAAAVQEFVEAFKKHPQASENAVSQYESLERELIPSRALDPKKSEFWLKDGTTTVIEEEPTPRTMQKLPLVSASCPAIVCYVEKSSHELVPHLSTVPSSMMSMCETSNFFHVAIQPCHDKKLESNRPDHNERGVDLVLTTSELLEFMNRQFPDVKDWSAIASTQGTADTREFETQSALSIFLGTLRKDSRPLYCCPKAGIVTSASSSSSEPFVAGSGGYADTIFRLAARDLFGIDVVPSWESVASTTRRGRGRSPKRDFYTASLYQMTDGSYSTKPSENSTLVWKFGIAYGLQTVQRIFADVGAYHYIEAMACAGSCLNGAGQLRLANPETPSETRERLNASREQFSASRMDQSEAKINTLVHTRFHIVPAMRHSMGIAAGVSVNDTNW